MTGTIHGEEVAKHSGSKSCWVVLDGKVYDITNFLGEHPGGASVLLEHAGRDVTEAFDEVHDKELVNATLPPETYIGTLQPNTLPKIEEKMPADAAKTDDSKPAYPPLDSIINVDDFEKVAQPYLSASGWAYYSSGAEDELSMNEPRHLFRKISLRPRVLRHVEPVSTACNILGYPSSLPFYISPTGIGKYAHRDAEPILTATAGNEGLVYCMPTTAPLDTIFPARVSENQPVFFQLYTGRDRAKAEALLQRVEALGVKAIFMTVDSPVLGRRERDDRIKGTSSIAGAGVAKTASQGLLNPMLGWDDVDWLRGVTSLPIVLKGVQTVEDAVLAFRAGVQGIVLSNHGGRSQDTAQAPIVTLLEIRRYAPILLDESVRDRFQIFLDGGFRRGTDIVKAIALGATAVGIGRPFLYSLTNDYGAAGVQRLVQMLRMEVETNMALLGARTIRELVPELVNSEVVERRVSRRVKL